MQCTRASLHMKLMPNIILIQVTLHIVFFLLHKNFSVTADLILPEIHAFHHAVHHTLHHAVHHAVHHALSRPSNPAADVLSSDVMITMPTRGLGIFFVFYAKTPLLSA